MLPPFVPHPHPFFVLPFFFGFGAIAVIAIIPYWNIFKKAGFSPWISLLIFVPLANLITLYVVAFSAWKVVPASQVYLEPGPPPHN